MKGGTSIEHSKATKEPKIFLYDEKREPIRNTSCGWLFLLLLSAKVEVRSTNLTAVRGVQNSLLRSLTNYCHHIVFSQLIKKS